MAPTAPPKTPRMSHRAKVLARLADPTLPRKVHREDNKVTDSFLHSKRDKKIIRKSAFRARVTESRRDFLQSTGWIAKSNKRRRPAKKSVALSTLGSLVSALPDVDEDEAAATAETQLDAKHRRAQASMLGRPGSLKRKETLVKAEIRRFGNSLAELARTTEQPASTQIMDIDSDAKPANNTSKAKPPEPAPSTANRWALIRGFITATMEQNPAFSGNAAGNSA